MKWRWIALYDSKLTVAMIAVDRLDDDEYGGSLDLYVNFEMGRGEYCWCAECQPPYQTFEYVIRRGHIKP